MALICGSNRGNKITEFKTEKDLGVIFGLHWQMAVIEVDVIEGFYCTTIHTCLSYIHLNGIICYKTYQGHEHHFF